MATKRLRQFGFSLLELIIVLLVMISLLAVAWPNLQRPLRRTTLSEAAQTLRSAIDDCRYRAIVTGQPIFIELRQGEGLLRAGSFDDFINRDATGAGAAVLDSTPALNDVLSDGQLPATNHSSLKTWKLPTPVVISLVRWTLADPVEQFGPASTAESAALAEVQLDSMVNLDTDFAIPPGTSQQTWWLPLVATGQGRDATIILNDSSVNQQITVTYASATGALEISR